MYTAHISYVLFTGIILYYALKYAQYKQVPSCHSTPTTYCKRQNYIFLGTTLTVYAMVIISSLFFDIGDKIIDTILIVIASGLVIDLYSDSIPPGKGYTSIIIAVVFFILDSSQEKEPIIYKTNLSLCLLVGIIYMIQSFMWMRQTFKSQILPKTKHTQYMGYIHNKILLQEYF